MTEPMDMARIMMMIRVSSLSHYLDAAPLVFILALSMILLPERFLSNAKYKSTEMQLSHRELNLIRES